MKYQLLKKLSAHLHSVQCFLSDDNPCRCHFGGPCLCSKEPKNPKFTDPSDAEAAITLARFVQATCQPSRSTNTNRTCSTVTNDPLSNNREPVGRQSCCAPKNSEATQENSSSTIYLTHQPNLITQSSQRSNEIPSCCRSNNTGKSYVQIVTATGPPCKCGPSAICCAESNARCCCI